MTAPAGVWDRLGFEVELLAPTGSTRAVLADALAARLDARVVRAFHHDTEPSLVQDRPVFHHLTHAFDVVDRYGVRLCRLADDVTIRSELDAHAGALDGWFRILSDEPRLLRLVASLCDPTVDACEVLAPAAAAFGVEVEARPDGRYRIGDVSGATVAIVTPQGGQRERVCELITPPLVGEHHRALDSLLEPARDLGFTVPTEAAVHVHLDAPAFRSPGAIAQLVRVFSDNRDELWAALGTNPSCRRLGALPAELVAGVAHSGFADQPWDEIRRWLCTLNLTKFADCNLLALRDSPTVGDTVELRILPGSIDATTILSGVRELADRLGPLS